MKNIEWLSPTQIKSLVDGGSMFFEILTHKEVCDLIEQFGYSSNMKNDYIQEFDKKINGYYISNSYRKLFNLVFKLQIGDEFYVQEEFAIGANGETRTNLFGYPKKIRKPKEDMQPHQSRVKGEIKNVELVRVSDVGSIQCSKIGINMAQELNKCVNDYVNYFNKVCQEKNLNITYDDNPCIILYEVEK